ncbi:MAG: U32 family peptidase [Sediminibacterium sp.]|uniref:U32 family peptidase n=1 Tax=Sediminibacterium sp. TaxID=1917865 RepID=UPI0027248005|nr:U32 family peptidase [Sediminibacterium sp.]MDO8996571.1 U32 family peptidase [Sediminibacterium sp.]
MHIEQIELLSPAGSFDCIIAAIKAGANSIYFGVEQLNMRSCSSNGFIISDIKKIKKICKENKVKAYLTLNSIIYGHDIQLLKKILDEAKKTKIDAVIAADFAVINLCKELEIPLHISTQANISNIESVRFFAQYAETIVLARELTLKQIAQISNAIIKEQITGPSGYLIKIEVFIHGSLCMAISGKCYLSLHSHQSSANRGACIQNCRRKYIVKDLDTNEELKIDNEYIMSPKDLSTINILPEIINSGVSILKIEGRSKGSDYVYKTTKCYKEAIISIKENKYNRYAIRKWTKQLSTVYNRGFWNGYYLGQKLGEWTSVAGSIAEEKKILLGRGEKYYPKIKIAEFKIESGTIKKGDTIIISGKHIGFKKIKLEKLYVNGTESATANPGDKITFPLKDKIVANDKIYKIIKETHV